MRSHLPRDQVGGLAHTAAVAALLVIFLLGVLRLPGGAEATNVRRSADCISESLLCALLDVCSEPRG